MRRWSRTSSETELRDRILREIGEKRKERGRKRETDRVGSWREGERKLERERTESEREEQRQFRSKGSGGGSRLRIRGCFQRSTQCSLVSRAGRTGENVRAGSQKGG